GTPTYARDLADAILVAIEAYKKESLTLNPEPFTKNGIYHYSNEGVCSWFDFTKMIAEYSGQASCDIQPCHSDEFPSKVKRPAYSVLDKSKIKETLGFKVPYWTESLKTCIKNLK
ncbi:MAG: sugar nucleotide-binding protein, partial [Aeriscardovia sp.]|nr:sugar nucleotide-binding protein [Aeriscardovia sp.]